MYRVATRSAVLSLPGWRTMALLLHSPARKYALTTPPNLFVSGQLVQISCFRNRRTLGGCMKATNKIKTTNNLLDDKDISHVTWWKERLQICRKPSTIQLISRLVFSNLLGVDSNLKNGSLKEGSLNWEMLQFKSKFPREVLLCRVGDFYEAIGIDACILVEYAGLNPFGGLRSDSIPRAGCPVVNLRQTLDDLTRNGYSVCIVEEVQGPTQARCRKGRFISGHAHPGSPYVYGLVGVDHDLEFPEPMPVIGISRSARGFCLVLVLETMKTYSLEDGLTEEALVTKLRTCHCHHLYLHASLRQNSSGTCRWGEYGEGGLLWAECNSRNFEWFESDPLTGLLLKVKELYGLDDGITFRNVSVCTEDRPHPLHLGTATQIGAIQTEGIPSLLKVLLPGNCTGLPVLYIRDLLLNPPNYEIATTVQATCRLMNSVTCSIPDFTCVSPAKLVKLLELRETNHIEFCRIKNVLDEVLHMRSSPELHDILKLLMDPAWVATGLKVEFETLVSECEWASKRIDEMISFDGESDQKISSFPRIPNEFFEDMESSWKGRIKRIHLEDEFEEVGRAAEALSIAVSEDFLPIYSRIKAMTSPLGGSRGEVSYSREHEAIWFKGKRFAPTVWAGTPGEEQIKQLKPALDSKGRKVGEEWFTTSKVEDALASEEFHRQEAPITTSELFRESLFPLLEDNDDVRNKIYHEANDKAKAQVLELLRQLSAELQVKMNILVFASTLLVIAKALFAHVSEAKRRQWAFPTIVKFNKCEDVKSSEETNRLKLSGLSPYWLDIAQGSAVDNTVDMQSLFLLTGPNGGGKSSLLRSICAAVLLGICGLLVPAEFALIPHFDSIMLHVKSYDSPADGKSSFQIEMSEIRSIITQVTPRSLVLIDEICRGTETAKGTCIAGSIIETLDRIGCLGIVSTHLHGLFNLPLKTNSVVYKAMGAEYVDGQTIPTWKLVDGVCRESLAFETAKREGVPETIIQRAEELYLQINKQAFFGFDGVKVEKPCSIQIGKGPNEEPPDLDRIGASALHHEIEPIKCINELQAEVKKAVNLICLKKLRKHYEMRNLPGPVEIQFFSIAAREQPPPSTIGASVVYVMFGPDKKIYVGETDDLEGRVRAHRSKEGMQNAGFLYFKVSGKSLACQLETLLINQLLNKGFNLTNVADGKHRNFGSSDISVEAVAALH